VKGPVASHYFSLSVIFLCHVLFQQVTKDRNISESGHVLLLVDHHQSYNSCRTQSESAAWSYILVQIGALHSVICHSCYQWMMSTPVYHIFPHSDTDLGACRWRNVILALKLSYWVVVKQSQNCNLRQDTMNCHLFLDCVSCLYYHFLSVICVFACVYFVISPVTCMTIVHGVSGQ